jgi:hypothetical protein
MMSHLQNQLEAARAEVARLEREARQATCRELGRHDWRLRGGRWCGCEDGGCSIPVHECSRCGDCDYGQNAEADEIKTQCALTD